MKLSGRVILRKGKEVSAQRMHPWIFSGAVQRTEGDLQDGAFVEVVDFQGETIGFGHFQPGSIAVRVLSFGPVKPRDDFYYNKLKTALETRKAAGLPSDQTNAFRLVHGEGDGLPGLIIDYYDGVPVVQAHSTGMHLARHFVADALKDLFPGSLKAVYYKSQGTLPGNLRDEAAEEYLVGMGMTPHIVTENGNRFYVDWEEGQKTGFFLDQRDNRKLLGEYSAGRSVLNTFCYTGGFSVYALNRDATLVHSVDSSAKAIEMTRRNLELNGFNANLHRCFSEDTFDFLKDKDKVYDVIVLDPPAFAKHRDARHQAVRGYQRLNTEAMKKIKPGGIIFTFSCSQVVDRQLFYDTIVSSAIQAGRAIKVLHHLSQPADHPVSVFHPEGEYLKGLVLFVE